MAQKIQLGMKGLNTDVPPYALPTEYFNAGINMRPKDGSIQTVPQASELQINGVNVFPVVDLDTPTEVNEIKMTKYIPDGFAYANMIVAGVDINGDGRIRFSTNHGDMGTPEVVDVGRPRYTGGTWLNWTYDISYGVDVFVFNSICIVNPKSTQPLFFNANDKTQMSMQVLTVNKDGTVSPDNWIFTSLLPLTSTTATFNTKANGESVITLNVAPTQAQLSAGDIINSKLDGTGNNYLVYSVGITSVVLKDVNGTASTDFATASPIYVQYPYTARYMTTFQGRMLAMNLKLIRAGNAVEYSPIEFAWSNPISSLQSLNGVVWTAASTNSAGNDYLTESAGEVLAAVPLGEYLVVYKSDQVYKSIDTGPPNYYISQPLYTDDGLLSPRGVIEINESKHLFVGNNGVWLHQGGIEKQNISRGRIEEFLYRGDYGIDFTYKNSVFCYHNQLEKEVWICYRSKQAWAPTPIGPGDVPGCNYAMCYNYQTDIWYWRNLGNEVGPKGAVSQANYATDIQDVIASGQTWTLACVPAANFDDVFVPNGLWYFPHVTPGAVGIYEENGYFQFDSRDIGTASIVKSCNGVFPHSDQPINMQLRFSNKISDTEAFNSTFIRRFDPNDYNYRLDYRETGRYMHLKLSTAGLNNANAIGVNNPSCNPRFTDMDVDLEQRGRR